MAISDIPGIIGSVFHKIIEIFFNIVRISIEVWFIHIPFWIRWTFIGIILLISIGFIIWAYRNRDEWTSVYH